MSTVPDTNGTVDGLVCTISPINGTDHNQVIVTLPAATVGGTGKLFVKLSGVLAPSVVPSDSSKNESESRFVN